MSYFSKFPLSVFTVDDYASGQVLPDLLRRAKLVNDLVVQNAFFDQYDLVDNETPEITADVFYGDPTLHWLVLHANEILDPRFDFPLSPFFLQKYTEGKYANVNAVHHYEDSSNNFINANISLRLQLHNISDPDPSHIRPTFLKKDMVLVNNTSNGVAVITNKVNQRTYDVEVSKGGFVAGEVLFPTDNVNYLCNVIRVTSINNNAIPVTNLIFEDRENENKRKISLLKPSVVGEIVDQFEEVIKQ